MGSWSAIPIGPIRERLDALSRALWARTQVLGRGSHGLRARAGDVHEVQPDAVVHLGECPSASYSMVDRDHAVFVQTNNIVSTFLLVCDPKPQPRDTSCEAWHHGRVRDSQCRDSGRFFEIEYGGRADVLPFPQQAGSWYHWSKVHGPRSRQQRGKRMSNPASDLRWS